MTSLVTKNLVAVLSMLALTAPASAEIIRRNIASGDITPCTKVELRQMYNATTRQAPQSVTVFATLDVPNVTALKVAAEQCLVVAAAAAAVAGTAAIVASPAAAMPAFKIAFDACVKERSAEQLAALKLNFDTETQCRWPGSNPAVAKDPRTEFPAFDLALYIALQDDVKAAFGGDLIQSENHWLQHGMREGRRGSLLFDVRHYISANSDVAAALGTSNLPEAVRHWTAYGLAEGRQSSQEFDVKFYLAQYEDLRKAFGPTGYAAAAQHWIQFGVAEGRVGSKNFDVQKYLAKYEDLRSAFGATNYRAAFEHWLHFGKKEGRTDS